MFAAVHGMRSKLRELKDVGVTEGRAENRQPMVGYDEYLEVIGLSDFRTLEQKFSVDPRGSDGER
eukprot:4568028-Prymnesium_polylepis.2